MNPDHNRGGMTVNALMQMELIVSAALPAIAIVLLGFASSQLDKTTLLLMVVAGAIIVSLGVLLVNYFAQRRIKDQLLGLVDACRNYAGGDHTVRVAVNGEDEFAQLASTLNALLGTQGGIQRSGGSSAGNVGDAATLQAQIEKLLQEVSAVGDGDLRVQAEVTPDTLGVLADSFNYMIEELAKVVGRVQATAVQVTNATRRILDGSAELAQASETQVGQISQTTEAVEALATFIQNVALDAQSSVDAAQEALRNATSGQQAVRQTIEGMMLIRENVQETAKKIKRLGERSNEIGEIVRIIEDIADQTNLLALNAAIQSAMAGEHGRGFAVVADEIRLLAERSTESTRRIETLVKSIQGDTYEAVVAMEDSTQEVVKGSQLADEAGRSLNTIYSAVERQTKMIENIAHAANEQSSVSEAVAVAMSQILEITRQTDAGTQEAAISVSYLADLAEQLRSSVSTFRLPDQANEIGGSFAPVAELPQGKDGQMFSQSLMAGVPDAMDSEWGQHFAANFPPLPEPNNSDSLVALSPRPSEQHAFMNQQDFGNQAAWGGQSLGNQPQRNQQYFGSQQYYQNQSSGSGYHGFGNSPHSGSQQDFTADSHYGNQQSFGSGQYSQQPGNQQDFGSIGGFERHQASSGSGQQFGAAGGFGTQNSSGYPHANQIPFSPMLPVPSGQPTNSRLRRQARPQQGQSPFNQDQAPFPDNG
jgi:methyl-accepting chemotaxis protein